MGLLYLEPTRQWHALSRRCLVGRGGLAHLRLTERWVSSEHATIYFDGTHWKVRDLGSRNGTYVGGEKIDANISVTLKRDDKLAFGSSAHGSFWTLRSERPPGPAAQAQGVALHEGTTAALWLPNEDVPEVCISLRGVDWVLDSPTGPRVVENGATIDATGGPWVLLLPETEPETSLLTETTRDADRATPICLEFSVSLDEEHVQLRAIIDKGIVSLGARAFNGALLALARRRIQEATNVSPDERGWIYADELRAQLRLDREALNLQLWRAMQALTKIGLPGERLIERRLDSQQLRVGFDCRVRSRKA
jgi:hypothetical protein